MLPLKICLLVLTVLTIAPARANETLDDAAIEKRISAALEKMDPAKPETALFRAAWSGDLSKLDATPVQTNGMSLPKWAFSIPTVGPLGLTAMEIALRRGNTETAETIRHTVDLPWDAMTDYGFTPVRTLLTSRNPKVMAYRRGLVARMSEPDILWVIENDLCEIAETVDFKFGYAGESAFNRGLKVAAEKQRGRCASWIHKNLFRALPETVNALLASADASNITVRQLLGPYLRQQADPESAGSGTAAGCRLDDSPEPVPTTVAYRWTSPPNAIEARDPLPRVPYLFAVSDGAIDLYPAKIEVPKEGREPTQVKLRRWIAGCLAGIEPNALHGGGGTSAAKLENFRLKADDTCPSENVKSYFVSAKVEGAGQARFASPIGVTSNKKYPTPVPGPAPKGAPSLAEWKQVLGGEIRLVEYFAHPENKSWYVAVASGTRAVRDDGVDRSVAGFYVLLGDIDRKQVALLGHSFRKGDCNPTAAKTSLLFLDADGDGTADISYGDDREHLFLLRSDGFREYASRRPPCTC